MLFFHIDDKQIDTFKNKLDSLNISYKYYRRWKDVPPTIYMDQEVYWNNKIGIMRKYGDT